MTAKTNGSAVFTQDIRTARTCWSPCRRIHRASGRPSGASTHGRARAVPGVVDVVQFPGGAGRFGGVAVLARNTWVAKQGRDALHDPMGRVAGLQAEQRGYPDAIPQPRRSARRAGQERRRYRGRARSRREGDRGRLRISVSGPRIDGTAQLPGAPERRTLRDLERRADAHRRSGSGRQTARPEAASRSRSRSSSPAAASAAARIRWPITCSRRFRSRARRTAGPSGSDQDGLDARGRYARRLLPPGVPAPPARGPSTQQGALLAWQQRVVGQSIITGTPFEAFMVKNGIDATSIEGSAEPYEIPNLRIELHTPTTSGYRSNGGARSGHTHTAFATECMIDELASAARQGSGRVSPRAARGSSASSRR